MAAKLKNKSRSKGSALDSMIEKKTEKIPYEVLEEEKLPGSRIRFKLSLSEDAVKGRLKNTLKEFNNYVDIPGFRKGKAPENIIRKRFEPAAREEMVKRMVGRLSELYTEEKSIEPLSRPYLLEWKSSAEEGTKVELALEVSPEIEIQDDLLSGLKAEIHAIKIDDAYVEKEIENLLAQNAAFEPTEDGYREKDGILLNCTVTSPQGERIEERCAQEHYTTRLEEEMPEEIAAALIGKKKGDTVSMNITEDMEGGAEGQVETVHYEVEVLEVKARALPELDDDFAQDISDEYETVADLKEGIRKEAAEKEEARQREETLERVYDQLRERIDFDLPRALVEQQTQNTIMGMERQLNQHGISLRQMDQTIVQNYAQSVRGQSRLTVKNSLLTKEISKKLDIQVGEELIEKELQRLAEESGRKPLAIRAQLEARKQWDGFVQDLSLKAAQDAILEKAEVTKKEVSRQEFEDMAKARQDEQAARLRGEEVKAVEQDKKEAESLNVSVDELDQKLAEGEVPDTTE